jgi:hypothetical protein
MNDHVFKVGQMVAYRVARWLSAPEGAYIVTAQLSGRNDEREYRIKHSSEAHERSARESDLSLPRGETSDGAP